VPFFGCAALGDDGGTGFAAAIGAAAVLIGAAIFLGVPTGAPRIYDVWREMLEGGRPAYLVTGDSAFVMLQDITGTEVYLNDYISDDLEKKFPGFHIGSTQREGNYGVDRFSNYTSTADLSIAVGVARPGPTLRPSHHPCNGSSPIVRWVTVAPMEPVSVRRMDASPTTLTTSVVSPISRVTSVVVVSPAFSWMPLRVSFLNPGCGTSNR
jgi:hypothetical protein